MRSAQEQAAHDHSCHHSWAGTQSSQWGTCAHLQASTTTASCKAPTDAPVGRVEPRTPCLDQGLTSQDPLRVSLGEVEGGGGG